MKIIVIIIVFIAAHLLRLASAQINILDESGFNSTANVTADYGFLKINWSWLQNTPLFSLASDVWTAISGNRTEITNIINSVNTTRNIQNLHFYNTTQIDANFSLYLLLTDSRFNDTTYINTQLNNYYNKTNIDSFNASWSSTYNSTYSGIVGNNSYLNNETYNYNQTIIAITDINSRFWNRTQSYNITQIENNFSNYYTKVQVDNNLTLYLLITDQRFNETSLINAVNKTGNIQGLGFYNITQIDSLISSINNTGNLQNLLNSTGIYSTYNITYAGLINNASYLSTYNVTYDVKADYQFTNNNFNGSGNFNTTGRIMGANQTMFDQLIINYLNWITISTSSLINYFTKTEVNNMISGNISLVRTDIQSNWSDLESRKLNISDQRYNDTAMINSVNNTGNIQGLNFYNTTQVNSMISGNVSSIGYFVNYTPITTTGNITNGTLKGYLAANNICNTYYSGSHMCQAGEVLNSINRNQSNVNFTATFRITEGAPGYIANANDCEGLTSASGDYLGAIWVGSTTHTNTYGSASLVACNAARAIGCCI